MGRAFSFSIANPTMHPLNINLILLGELIDFVDTLLLTKSKNHH